MKTDVRTAALAAASVLALSGAAIAQTSATATTDVNLRAGPGTQHPVVGVVPGNQSVTIQDCAEGMAWCQVSFDGQIAWVSSQYLDTAGVGTGLPGPATAAAPAGAPPDWEQDPQAPAMGTGPTGQPMAAPAGPPVAADVPEGMPPDWGEDPQAPVAAQPAPGAMGPPDGIASAQLPAAAAATSSDGPQGEPPDWQNDPDAPVMHGPTAPTGQVPAGTTATAPLPPTGGIGAGTAGVAGGAAVGAALGGPVGAAVGGAAGAGLAGATGTAAPAGQAEIGTQPPQHVLQHIAAQPVQPAELEADVVVGTGLPAHIELHAVPDYEYDFAFVNQQRVLVDPQTREVMFIVG